jgi:hypothetical protein
MHFRFRFGFCFYFCSPLSPSLECTTAALKSPAVLTAATLQVSQQHVAPQGCGAFLFLFPFPFPSSVLRSQFYVLDGREPITSSPALRSESPAAIAAATLLPF